MSNSQKRSMTPYQIQYRNLHHALVEVSRLVFDHFDCHDLLGLHILAFHYLAKGSLSQNIQDKVSVPSVS